MNEELNEVLIEEKKEVKEEVKKEVKKEVKEEVKKETKKATPKLFFKQDNKVEISVDGYHSNETGELQFVINSETNEYQGDENLEDIFTKVVYKFWFSRCPYDKLNRYRSRSMIYNSEDQNNTINELRLREYFLVFHLVDWNLTDENGEKIELKFDTNKALSDDSLKLIYTLPANLIDTVLSNYEKKMGI